MRYHVPASCDEALAVLASGAVTLVAGGTDVYPALKDQPLRQPVLDIARVPGLRGISRTPDGWRIGATTTWTDIARANLPPYFDGLKAAAREVGSVQIQNMGTIAGNLCNASPAADGIPPLLTLDAAVEVASLSGKRVVPLAAFVTGVRRTDIRPSEMVTAVLIPEQSGRAAFLKLGARRYLVISIAMVAVLIETDETGHVVRARVAVGACSPVARRLPALEAALVGQPMQALAPCVRPDHLVALSPIDDVRADAGYRLTAAAELIRRALTLAVPSPVEVAA